MPIDVTAFLVIEKKQLVANSGTREIVGVISLNEGHDRPVWEWIKYPGGNGPCTRWIPSEPKTILVDGLLMFATEGLRTLELIDEVQTSSRTTRNLTDLTFGHLDVEASRGKLGKALKDFIVNVVTYNGSSARLQAEENSARGISIRKIEVPDIEYFLDSTEENDE